MVEKGLICPERRPMQFPQFKLTVIQLHGVVIGRRETTNFIYVTPIR
jgi:hypothetical protein